MILLLLACTGTPEDSGSAWVADELDALPLPDFSDVDLDAAVSEALVLATTTNSDIAWRAHAELLKLRQDGCPDLYAGPPPGADADMDERGVAWQDSCRTSGGRSYGGWAWWQTELSATAGQEGHRVLQAQAAIANGGELELYVRGSGEEGFLSSGEEGSAHWTRNSTLDWTVEGSAAEALGLPEGGLRSDLSLEISGGDLVNEINASGNAYFPTHRIADRFDSFDAQIQLQGELGAAPDDCTLEPRGYVGLRDPDAHWVHVVFLPTDEGGDTGIGDGRSVCDGCGTVYIRGVEQPEPVCPDFSALWPLLEAPQAKDYLLSVRETGGAG